MENLSLEVVWQYVLDHQDLLLIPPIVYGLQKIGGYLSQLTQIPEQLKILNFKFERYHQDVNRRLTHLEKTVEDVNNQVGELRRVHLKD